MTSSLLSKAKTGGFLAHRKLLVALVVGALVLTAIPALIYYANSTIDDLDIEIERIRVKGHGPDYLELEVDVVMDYGGARSAELEATELEVLYQSGKLGSFALPELKVETGQNRFTVNGKLTEGGAGLLDSFVTELLTSEGLTVQLKGEVTPKGLFSMGLDLDKTATIKGFANMTVAVNSIELVNAQNGDLNALVQTTVNNPSIFELPLPDLALEARFNNQSLTTFAPEGWLVRGENRLNMTISLATRTNAAFNAVVTAVLQGEGVTLGIHGSGATGDLFARLGAQFTHDVALTAPGEALGFDLLELDLLAEGDETLALEARYTLSNPTPVVFDNLTFTADFHNGGRRAGSLVLPDLTLAPGDRTEARTLSFTGINQTVMSTFVAAYLEDNLSGIELKGSLASGWVSATDQSFPLELEIPALEGELSVAIRSINYEEATADALNLTLGLETSNPTFFSGQVTNATFDLLINDTLVTPLTLPTFHLPTGNATHNLSVSLDLAAAGNLTLLVDELLDGRAVNLTLAGRASEGALLSQFIASVSLDTQLAASGPLNITLLDVYLEEAGADYLDLAVLLEVDNPTPLGGLLTDLSFDLFYEGELLGQVTFPQLRLGQGRQQLNLSATLTDAGGAGISDFVAALIKGDSVTLEVKGNPTTGLLSGLLDNLTFEAEFTPSRPFDLALGQVTLEEVLDDRLVLVLELEVDNPLPFSGLVSELAFEIRHNDTYLGLATLNTLTLQKGYQTHNLSLAFFPVDPALVQELVRGLLQGHNATLTINASRSGSSSFLSELLGDLNFTLGLNTTGPLELSLKSIAVAAMGETEALLNIVLEVNNPTNLQGLLSTLAFDLYINETFSGSALLERVHLLPGSHIYNLTATFTSAPGGAMGQVVNDLLHGRNSTLELRAAPANGSGYLAELLTGLNFTLNLTTTGSLGFELAGVEILEIGEQTLRVALDLLVDNPTSLEGILSDLALHVFEGAEYLGSVQTENLVLPKGASRFNVTAVITPASPQPMQGLLTKLFDGTNVTLRLVGDPDNCSGFLTGFVEGLEFNMSLTTEGNFTVELVALRVDAILSDSLNLTCTLRVNNPTSISGLLTYLSFDIYYEGSYLDRADLASVNLVRGTSLLNLTTTVTPADPDILGEMAQALLEGNNLSLTARGSDANTSAFLPQVMAGLEFDLTITTTGQLEIKVGNMSLLEATEDRLRLKLEVALYNPADLAVYLDRVYFDIYSGDEKVGEALLYPFMMNGGWNNPRAEAIFTGEQAALEQIVTDYINGVNRTFTLQPASNISETLVGTILANLNQTITLPGLDVDFISEVKVQSLSVGITPLSVRMTVRVTISNPTDFSIEVTRINKDVHYDDNDESSVFMLGTYSAKDNIYLDTVNEAINPPLEVDAHSTAHKDSTITTSSKEHCIRLNDEYNVDDDLVAHVYGEITIKVGSTELVVEFTQTDIRVPR